MKIDAQQSQDGQPTPIPDEIAGHAMMEIADHATAISLFCKAMNTARLLMQSRLGYTGRLQILSMDIENFSICFEVEGKSYPFFALYDRQSKEGSRYLAAVYSEIDENGVPSGKGAGVDLRAKNAAENILKMLDTIIAAPNNERYLVPSNLRTT